MTHSDEIKDIAASLAKAQGQIEGAKRNAKNPHLQVNYANLAAVWDACREPLSVNGLGFMQFPDVQSGVLILDSMLTHETGQWIRHIFSMPVHKLDAQGIGTVITYAKRYAMCAILGIASDDDDDDAQSATDAAKNAPRQNQNRTQPKPEPKPEPEDAPPPVTKSMMDEIKAQIKARADEYEYKGTVPLLAMTYCQLPEGQAPKFVDYQATLDAKTTPFIKAVEAAEKIYMAKRAAQTAPPSVPVEETAGAE